MKIAVQTRFLRSGSVNARGYFIYELFTRIIRDHPETEFVFIAPGPVSPEFQLPPDIKIIYSAPKSGNYTANRYWWDIRLPLLLKKMKVDIFFGGDGQGMVMTKISQCILSDDLHENEQQRRYSFTAKFLRKRYFHKAYEKAACIFYHSESHRSQGLKKHGSVNERSSVLLPASQGRTGHDDDNRSSIRNAYSEGKLYFLYRYTGVESELITLLKGFSIFKKRQHTGMRLLIFSPGEWPVTIQKSLDSYRYRDDVKVVEGSEQDFRDLLEAAYGFLHTVESDGPAVFPLMSLVAGVPVIINDTPANREIAGNAALYTDGISPSSISEKMMLLYKDELLRSEMVDKGREQGMKFSWERAATEAWNKMIQIVSGKSQPD